MTGYLHAGAAFSDCTRYRYELVRCWELHAPCLVVIGLNPSTATETEDDPTIRRCVGFAKREGYGGLIMLNLFAYRSTDPTALEKSSRKGEWENLVRIQEWCNKVSTVLAAWGSHPMAKQRLATIPQYCWPFHDGLLYCLGTTKDGSPRHPLYVRADQPFLPYELPTSLRK